MSASPVKELIRYAGSATEGSHVFTPGVSVASGHHIILTIGLNVDYPDTVVSSITDSNGNSYSIDAQGGSPNSDSETICIACGYIANALDDIDSITVTLSNSSAIMTVEADEWSGLEQDPYDTGDIGNYAAATSHSSPSIIPAQIGDLLVSAMITVGGGGGEDPPLPPPLDAQFYVSPTGSDSNDGSEGSPFASLNQAYQASSLGDIVQILPGTYNGNMIINSRSDLRNIASPPTPENPSKFIHFVGAGVTITGKLEIHGSCIWIDGGDDYGIEVEGYVDTEGDSNSVYPDHIYVYGTKSSCFGIFNADYVWFKHMDVGPLTATTIPPRYVESSDGIENKIGFASGYTHVPTNIVMDDMHIRDQNGDEGRIISDLHAGGFFLAAVDGLDIKNSIFERNVVYQIQVQPLGGVKAQNVTIDNCAFGNPADWLYNGGGPVGGGAIQFDTNGVGQYSGFTIQRCAFANGVGVEGWSVGDGGPVDWSGYTFTDNTFGAENVNAPPLRYSPNSVVANIWVDPVNGDDLRGTRSSTPVENGVVTPYKTVHAANSASQGGDVVAFMPGVYTPVNAPAGGWERIDDSASKGAGNDINPNSVEQGFGAVATPTNWVTWVPGEGAAAAKDSIQLTPFSHPRLFFDANMHLIIDSSSSPGAFFIPVLCFGWYYGQGFTRCQNMITKHIHVQGIGVRHSKNIWMQDTEIGPNVYGAASGYGAILASGSPIGIFEEGYAGRGNGDLDELQFKITEVAENFRLDRAWNHDKQSRDSIEFHTGALWIANGWGWPDANIVIDGMVSERVTHNGILLENGTDGILIQNCFIGLTTKPLDQTSNWAEYVPEAFGLVVKDSTDPNYVWKYLLVRYCVFESGATVGPNEYDFLNWRFIGNIFGPLGLNVEDYPGEWTVDYNASVNATHGTNAISITALSNHYTDIAPGSAPSVESQLDLTLTAGAKSFEDWVPASADANITLDIEGKSRVAPYTAGPMERGV